MAQKQPDMTARIVGGIIVGVIALWITSQFSKSPGGRISGVIVGVALHEVLAAPITQAVSDAGL